CALPISDKQPPQNPGGNSLCRRHLQPSTNAYQSACSSLPTDARRTKTQAHQSCVDRCAPPPRASAPAPPSAAHLPTPSVIPDTVLISDTAPHPSHGISTT